MRFITYDCLLFYRKLLSFPPMSSDKGEEKQRGKEEGGGQNLCMVPILTHLD